MNKVHMINQTNQPKNNLFITLSDNYSIFASTEAISIQFSQLRISSPTLGIIDFYDLCFRPLQYVLRISVPLTIKMFN